MIEIGINPNTQQASVVEILHGYFGLGKDGVKLVDQDTVFEMGKVKLAGEIPSDAFDMLQKQPKKGGDKVGERDSKGRFVQGHRPLISPNAGRPKLPITERVREVLDFKHYEKKDGSRSKIKRYQSTI